jgi:hypothetical protein
VPSRFARWARVFSPQTQSIVMVGDKVAVAEQLKEFGEFTVSAK